MSDRPYETGARELLKWLEDRLSDFNNNHGDMLQPQDRRDAQDAYVSLRSNFNGIARHFFEPARERDATLPESGYHFLWGLMNACFLAGARTVLSDSAAKWRDTKKSVPARTAKLKNHEPKKEALIEAIIDEARAQGKKIHKGDKCATELHSGVKARLPQKYTRPSKASPNGWPHWSTIQKTITAKWDVFISAGVA